MQIIYKMRCTGHFVPPLERANLHPLTQSGGSLPPLYPM